MELPPQPPPDVAAPPAGPEAIRSKTIFRRILVIGILSFLFSLGLLWPFFFGNRLSANRQEAINHAKAIHHCLIDFDNDYGSFPDPSTIVGVKDATSTSLPLGSSSSNEIFRQLIAAGHKSERIFWATSTITPTKPDNNISGSHALEKGECAFAYVAGLSNSSDPTTPVLMTPVDPGKRCFERLKDYDNKAVILFLDGSVKLFPIDKHGQVEIGGMNIFDPHQLFWKGKAPDIKWPE